MEKHLSKVTTRNNYGVAGRIGKIFHKEIEDIKIEKLKNGTSRDKLSTEKITNIIVRHKIWKNISKDIINLNPEEVDVYGNKK